MNDHLTTLARRALQPAAIHPRGQSRFEADSSAPRSLEHLAEEPVVPSAPVPSRASPVPQEIAPVPVMPQPQAIQPVVIQPIREEPVRPSSVPLVQTASRISPIAAEPSRTPRAPDTAVAGAHPASRPEPSPRIERVESQRIERQVQERSEVRRERVEHQDIQQRTLEQRVERLTLLEPHAAVLTSTVVQSTPAAAPVLAQPAAPRVEISIGRIEVLPLESTPAPRREEPARRPAAQTLDAYLEQRNGAGQGRGGRG